MYLKNILINSINITEKLLRLLLILLFLVFPLGQFSKIESFTFSNLYLPDILVAVIVSMWMTNCAFRRSVSLTFMKTSILGFFFCLAFSLAANFNNLSWQQFIVAFLYLVRFISYASLYFVIHDLLERKVISKRFIYKGLIFSGVSLALLGIEQYLLFPDMRIMKLIGWDDHYYRIISTLIDPNFSGVIFSGVTLLLIGDYFLGNKFSLAIVPITTIALFLTYSRTAFVSFLIGLIYLFLSLKKTKALLAIVLSFVLILFILPKGSGGEGVKLGRVNSLLGRLDSMKQSVLVFENHPIVGVGFNAYKFIDNKDPSSHSSSGVENSYLLILVTSGVIGLIAFLNLILNFAYYTKARFDSLEGGQKISLIISTAILISLLTSALSLNSLFYPWIMIWVFLTMALV